MPAPDDRTANPLPTERTLPAPDPPTRVASSGLRTEVQPVHPFAPLGLPSVAGYTITREIGRGGMGVVYAACDPVFDREVAVKVMHPGQDAGRFVVEAKVTARLPHPGIPPVYNLGCLADGRPYLAMKLIRGKTLTAEVNEADLPELLGVFEQICQTVGFAHAKGIVHRDLKPQNVMVGPFGEVLVMDWGLARFVPPGEHKAPSTGTAALAMSSEAAETIAGEVKGTPAYMAPEQARGEDIDARADVFALGGILATILTGKPTFRGKNPVDTVLMAARGELDDCFALLDACGEDPALVEVAKRALAPNPYDRFDSGAEVAAAVAEYRAHVQERLQRAERARAVSAAEAREQRKRRKVQLALLGAVTLLLGGAGAFALWESNQRAARTRKAEQEKIQQEYQKEQADRSARAAIDLAVTLRGQLRFKDAERALEQGRPAAEQAGPELADRIDRTLADTRFAKELDTIRYQKWEWIAGSDTTGEFNEKVALAEYERAFADRGFRLRDSDPPTSARSIAASPIKRELVAAIDDWATYEPNPRLRDRLLEVARLADPHPSWNAFRDPAVWRDRAALSKLAESVKPEATPAGVIAALAEVMKRAGLNPAPLLTAARGAHPNDFALAFSLGLWYAGRREYGREIGPYEAARAIRPDNPSALNNLGVAYTVSSDYPAAVAIFREYIRRDPTNATAHSNLGGALYSQRDYAGAVAAYRDAVKHSRTPADALSNLGSALVEEGKLEEAIEANRRACELNPRSCRFRTNLAVAYRRSGDFQNALACYREAVELDPTNVFAQFSFGLLWQDTGHTEAAVQRFKVALRLDPNYALAHNNLGNAYIDLGRAENAIASLLEAIRLEPRSAMAHSNLGNAYRLGGDFASAHRAYNTALRLDPNYVENYSNIGNAHHQQGNYPAAIAAYTEAIRRAPNFAVAYFNMGNALRDSGDAEGALAAFRKAIALAPNLSQPHNNLGWLLLQRGEIPGALAAFQEATRLNPRNAVAHTNLASVYLLQEKYDAALKSAELAVRFDPTHAQGHATLGLARLKRGDLAGARAALTEAARLDKRFAAQLAELPLPVAPSPRAIDR